MAAKLSLIGVARHDADEQLQRFASDAASAKRCSV